MMIVAVVSLAFVFVCLTSGTYANTATQKQPLKIVWKNKNITEKLNPALSEGEIYVIV